MQLFVNSTLVIFHQGLGSRFGLDESETSGFTAASFPPRLSGLRAQTVSTAARYSQDSALTEALTSLRWLRDGLSKTLRWTPFAAIFQVLPQPRLTTRPDQTRPDTLSSASTPTAPRPNQIAPHRTAPHKHTHPFALWRTRHHSSSLLRTRNSPSLCSAPWGHRHSRFSPLTPICLASSLPAAYYLSAYHQPNSTHAPSAIVVSSSAQTRPSVQNKYQILPAILTTPPTTATDPANVVTKPSSPVWFA